MGLYGHHRRQNMTFKESDVYRRQILTYKVDPRALKVVVLEILHLVASGLF